MRFVISAMLAVVTVVLSGKVFAGATFTWVGEPMGDSGDTISTIGELVYAYDRNASSATNEVNGVRFCGIADEQDLKSSSKVPDFTASPKFQYWSADFKDESVSGTYGSLLANGFWGRGEGFTNTVFTLKNLTPGSKYLVQLIIHIHERNIPVTVGDQTIYPYGDSPWKYGGSLKGVFTATATEEQFTVGYTSKSVFNAIQVRRLDKDPMPLVIRLR